MVIAIVLCSNYLSTKKLSESRWNVQARWGNGGGFKQKGVVPAFLFQTTIGLSLVRLDWGNLALGWHYCPKGSSISGTSASD